MTNATLILSFLQQHPELPSRQRAKLQNLAQRTAVRTRGQVSLSDAKGVTMQFLCSLPLGHHFD